ncbi:tetratricopeptide repeat protein [Shewanella schlegeliana]|uniref:Tetratricopeptide repeat protein n=2 Tax=Shewanella schlegeliana TaxID=190308 RepID=A0ABS1SW67_9GAMM|nr:tetratricopeptide repeat protein [Shewanella schlegeliana]
MNFLKLSLVLLLSISPFFAAICHGRDLNVSHGRELNRYESGLLNKASPLLEANDFDAALKLMLPLLEQAAPHHVVFQYVCKTLADTGAEAKALNCWERGYQLYPNQGQIVVNLAQAQLQTERYEAAISTLSNLELSTLEKPIEAQVRYMRGYAYYQLAQYQAAIDLLLSSDVKLHWWPLISYSQMALEQWQEAKSSALQWLAFEPDSRTAWQVLTRSELGLGNKLEAAVASDIAAQSIGAISGSSRPQDSIGLFGQIKAYNLAASCTSQTDTDDASRLGSAIKVFDSQALACAQYAWLSGRYDEALVFLEGFNLDGLSESCGLVDDFYLLQGQLFSALKQGDNARRAWSKVGQQLLPLGTAAEIKHARQRRNQLQGQALLLIGQSYWLEQQWPEAQASYRKLAQTPGFETLAAAFGQRLATFVQLEEKLR